MSGQPDTRRDVFISYNSKDLVLAEALEATLKAAGLTVWRDKSDLRSGDPVRETIPKAIREAGAVAVIWSENSVASSWVTFEAHYAIGAGKIAPLAADGFDAKQLEKFFRGDHYELLSDVLADPAAYVARLKELAATPFAGMQILHPNIRSVPGFTGREDLLAGIDGALRHQGGTAALTNSAAHAAAVKGLGGVGKSVLAREYAWRARGRYHGVWWVRAETEQTLIDDLIDLGGRLRPNLKDVQERDRALRLALDAIAAAGGDKPWLIVYDNVEKPGAIARLTPKTGAHILITSRWPRWQGHAQELPVDVFPEETAVAFLLAERPNEAREAAGRLAAALGFLPLALSHARAYCAESNLSFDNYARRLSELIREAPEDAEYPASVFATFSLAIAKAAEASPEAEKLMQIAAFLAPERIPLDIITDDVMSEKQREKAVAALFRVSLITHEVTETSTRAFSLHRLVQEAVRGCVGESGKKIQQIAVRLMHNAVDAFSIRRHVDGSVHEHVNWPRMATLLPHAVALLETVANHDHSKEVGSICGRLAVYLEARGDYPTAEHFSVRALAIAEAVLGPEHPDTAMYLNFRASLYEHQECYQDAEPLFIRAIGIAQEALGADHPEVGIHLNDLANIYRGQGRYCEAELLYVRALAIVEAALGPDHPYTSIFLTNLAFLYAQQNRDAEAERLHSRAVTVAEAALGPDHPATGNRLANLAYFYSSKGRYSEAKPLYLRALAIFEDRLGPDHPETHAVSGSYERLRQKIASDL